MSAQIITRLGMQMKEGTWRNFRWDLTSAVFISLFNAVFGQFYIPMAIRHGASNVEVGVLTAAAAIGTLFSPIWASLASRRAIKPFVIYPSLIARLSLVVVALVTKSWMFVGISIFINLLSGIQAPAYPALITRMYPPALRGRLMGYVRVAMGSTIIPLTYLIGRWTESSGDAGVLYAAAAAGVVSTLVFAKVREVEPEQEPGVSPKISVREQWHLVKSNRALAAFLIATTLSGFGNMLANPLYQIFQVHTLNLTDTQIGLSRTAYYAALLIAYFCMGWIIDRFPPKVAMSMGIAAYCAVPLIYVVFGSYGGVILGNAFQGVGDATWDIGAMSYIFKVAPGREAVVFGLHLLLFGVRGTIGPLLGSGLSHTIPMSWILLSAAMFSAVGCVLLIVMNRPRAGGVSPRRRLRRKRPIHPSAMQEISQT